MMPQAVPHSPESCVGARAGFQPRPSRICRALRLCVVESAVHWSTAVTGYGLVHRAMACYTVCEPASGSCRLAKMCFPRSETPSVPERCWRPYCSFAVFAARQARCVAFPTMSPSAQPPTPIPQPTAHDPEIPTPKPLPATPTPGLCTFSRSPRPGPPQNLPYVACSRQVLSLASPISSSPAPLPKLLTFQATSSRTRMVCRQASKRGELIASSLRYPAPSRLRKPHPSTPASSATFQTRTAPSPPPSPSTPTLEKHRERSPKMTARFILRPSSIFSAQTHTPNAHLPPQRAEPSIPPPPPRSAHSLLRFHAQLSTSRAVSTTWRAPHPLQALRGALPESSTCSGHRRSIRGC